ncbi:winged helix-turn-helix domain-containing protein [Micromonospora sp. NBC_00898]|uniref:winged helix-turn-helix domain-containing protein n=1 Tax=Micromonospora sp. NBC_00898 TaxID=2975981 RepID=UPI00386CC5B0|nr:winged helix-turn-helix domain-containing protein [Micromonospora sp. NBC_00898]
MSSRLILLPPAPLRGRTAGDADEPAVTVEISIVIRAVESAAEAAQDLAERLCAVARGGARIENIPAQAAHVAGDTATAHPRDARLAPARRLRVAPGPAEPELVLRPVRRTALLNGAPTAMTRLEYDLLLFLARHPHQVLTRGQLLSEVWGYEDLCGARTVDVHVRRIRQKLAGHGPIITTVRGVGYRLDAVERLRVMAD